MPAPTPRMQLMTMSHAMLRANRQATPLKKKIESPTIRILSLSLPSESFPESSTKGIISSDGSEVSIWISRSVTLGNTLFRSPRIGETASPGSDSNGRHGPDCQQHDERNGAFSCLDFHSRGF